MKSLQFLSSVAIFEAIGLIGSAQTVSFMDPVMLVPLAGNVSAPAGIRTTKKTSYPDSMKDVSEIGYVLVTSHVEANGKGVRNSYVSNSDIFERSLAGEREDWRITPARINGKPVETTAYYAILFNPKSFSGAGYDSGPILKHISPVSLPRRDGDPYSLPIRASFSVDESGHVTAIKFLANADSASRKSLCDQIISTWIFSPATLNGKPVKSSFEMAIVVEFTFPKSEGSDVAPVIVHQEDPEYPEEMSGTIIRGEVLVDFVVTPTGNVSNVFALRSTGPWFDAPAVRAVSHWKFKPGTKNEVPVNTHMQVPVVFLPYSGGRDAFTVSGPGKKQGVFPIGVNSIVLPVYPLDLATSHKEGKGTVQIFVGVDGVPLDVRVVKADFAELGAALAASAWCFNFTPAYKDGKPIVSSVTMDREFLIDAFSEKTRDVLELERKHPEKIRSGRELDAPLVPISRHPIAMPRGLRTDRTILVEFLVDKEGKAQFPRVAASNPDVFDFAAMQAVSNWLFEIPKINGHAVVVRAQVPFVLKSD